mgnify:CR=1 FL=1
MLLLVVAQRTIRLCTLHWATHVDKHVLPLVWLWRPAGRGHEVVRLRRRGFVHQLVGRQGGLCERKE